MKRYEPRVTLARRATLTLVLPAALLALGGCAKQLKMERVENTLKDGVKQQLGMVLDAVGCPEDDRKAKTGDRFECVAKPAAGGNINLEVTVKDSKGAFDWKVTKIEGLLDLQPAQEAVKQGLEGGQEIVLGVSCGERWQAGKAGDSFECRAEFGDGQTATVQVNAKDVAGKISWTMQ